RRLADAAPGAREPELEIAVASAFPQPRPAGRDGNAARDDEIDAAERGRCHRLTELRCAGDRRRLGEPRAEALRIETQETLRLAESWHRHEHDLALAQRAQAEGALGRIGIALQPTRRFPFGKLGGTSRGRLGAAEIRNAAGEGKGESAGTPTLEPCPHALPDRLLVALRRSDDAHPNEEFTMWSM